MNNASGVLDRQFYEMRWRCLSLAADIDRLGRSEGGRAAIESDPRMIALRQALEVLKDAEAGRAERVQMIFSDLTPLTPPPSK